MKKNKQTSILRKTTLAIALAACFVLTFAISALAEESNIADEIAANRSITIKSMPEDATIVVIDTGSNYAENVERLSVLGDNPLDDNGHGDKMMKTIYNANPNANVISIKALNELGFAEGDNIVKAIDLAIEKNADIILMAFTAPDNANTAVIKPYVEKALANGIEVVAAAGNSGGNASMYVPANIDGVLTIAACDENMNALSSSNHGNVVDYTVNSESSSEAAARFAAFYADNNIANNEQIAYAGTISSADVKSDTYVNENNLFMTAANDEISVSGQITTVSAGAPWVATDYTYATYGLKITRSGDTLTVTMPSYSAWVSPGGHDSTVAFIGILNVIENGVVNKSFSTGWSVAEFTHSTTFDNPKSGTVMVRLGVVTGGIYSGAEGYGGSSWANDGWAMYCDPWAYGNFVYKDFNLKYDARTYEIKYDKGDASSGTAPEGQTKTYGVNLTLRTNTGNLKKDSVTISPATVTYNGNGGTAGTSSSTSSGTRNYSLAGWKTTQYEVPNPEIYDIGGIYTANAAQTLYPSFTSSISYTAVTLTSASRSGYDFNGWFTAASGGTKAGNAGDSYTPTGNITLYAQWTSKNYTVTFDKQGGSGGTSSVTATYGSAMPSATMPTRTGYTFGGYYTSTGGSGTQYYTAAGASTRNWDKTSNTTLYAKWTARISPITLDQQGGSGGTTSVTATYESPMPSIILPTRTGYTFKGYYAGTNGSGNQYYTETGASARNWDEAVSKLYAKWAANGYTITFDKQGGSGGSDSVTAIYDSAMPSVSIPARTGYTFEGYYTGTESGGVQYYTASGTSAKNWNIASDTTLYAKWKANTYKVTLNQQNGSGGTASVTATYDSAMPSATMPTRTGYTFGGYYTNTGGAGTQYYTASGTSARNWDIASNTTLYAKWTANQNTITFDKQGGTGGSEYVTVTYDQIMPTTSIPEKTGYIFGGYYTEINGGGTQYYDAYGVGTKKWDEESDATFYAKWTLNTYIVAYNKGDATSGSAPASQTKIHGTTLTLQTNTGSLKKANESAGTRTVILVGGGGGVSITSLTDPTSSVNYLTSTGTTTYTMSGWATYAGGPKVYNAGGGYTTNEAITLYPAWSSSTSFSAVTLPAADKAGYIFDGWYTAANGGTKIGSTGSSYVPPSDITIFAHWTPESYLVEYNVGDATSGTVPENQAKIHGTTLTLRNNTGSLSKENNSPDSRTVIFNANGGEVTPGTALSVGTATYTFIGWSTTCNGEKEYNAGGSYTNNESVVLYPAWSSSISYSAVTLPTPTKAGTSFTGWYTAAEGGTKVGNAGVTYTPTGNVTLYAHWSSNSYTVSYNKGDATSGTAPANQTKTTGVALTLQANTGNLAHTQTTENTTRAASITLTYDANGGTGAPRSHSGSSVSVPGQYKVTWNYDGWSTVLGGTKTYDASGKYTKDEAVVLYPAWAKTKGTTTWTAQTASVVISSTKPTRSSYEFLGWSTSNTATAASYVAGETYTKNITDKEYVKLYAVWQFSKYKVTLQQNGATTNGSPTELYELYNSGWYRDSGLTSTISKVTVPKLEYSIQLHAAPGSFVNASDGTISVSYKFDGYFTEPSGGTRQIGADGTILASPTIKDAQNWYAHWQTTKVKLPDEKKCKQSGVELLGWTTINGSATVMFAPGEQITPMIDGSPITHLYAIWSTSRTANLGGLIGSIDHVEVNNCYSTSSVGFSKNSLAIPRIGGLIGSIRDSE